MAIDAGVSVETIVIVGAGHAAGQVVATLKQKKFGGMIVVIGDEPYLPYQRPPLSKKFLAGEIPAERLYVKPANFYDDAHIKVCLNTQVTSIDRNAARVVLNDGDTIPYDKLVIATGSRVRQLDVNGGKLAGIHYLRSIADVDRLRADFERFNELVIVGAGYIGLEVAAVCRKIGLNVTVLELADRVMSRVVSTQVSDFYQQEHRAQGVKLILSTGLSGFLGSDRVNAVQTDNEKSVPADIVLVGVGIMPNTELAEAAGLDVNNGIVVDAHCRSSDANIFAVGDCTSHPNDIYNRRIRLESVHNALEQAKTAASNICGGDVRYSQVPWFWSDQYDLKLQIAGLSAGYDDVVIRGNPVDRSFSCLYLQQDRLIAVDAINAPRDFMQSKALIASAATPSRHALADSEISLKDLA